MSKFKVAIDDALFSTKSFLVALDECAYTNNAEELSTQLNRYVSDIESSIGSLKINNDSTRYNLNRITSMVTDLSYDRDPNAQDLIDQVQTIEKYLQKI